MAHKRQVPRINTDLCVTYVNISSDMLTIFTLVDDEVHEVAEQGHDDAEDGQKDPVLSHFGDNNVVKRSTAF